MLNAATEKKFTLEVVKKLGKDSIKLNLKMEEDNGLHSRKR